MVSVVARMLIERRMGKGKDESAGPNGGGEGWNAGKTELKWGEVGK